MKIVRAEVTNFFEGVKAKKHPPPEEKIDPVMAKRTIDALKQPPPSPPQSNYDRIIERSYIKAERSGSTISDQKIAQLGEQANQSCPPLKVSSDIVANHPVILPGTNLGDYLPDDAHYTSTGSLSSKMELL